MFKVGLPIVKEQPPVSKATWDDELDELKLYVVGIPTVTTKAEVLAEFMKDGNCEVHMMQNNALVNFGNKKNAARAIKRLHNKFMFPGSSRFISVRYARKNSYNTPSAKHPPSQKPSKVRTMAIVFSTFVLPFTLCFLLHTGNCCKQATGYKIEQDPQRKKSTKPKAIEGTMAIVFTTFFS